MSIKKTCMCVVALLWAMVAIAGNVVTGADGITVILQGDKAGLPRLVRLQVLGDKIVRVSATPEKSFPDAQSLVVIPQPPYTRCDIKELPNEVVVSTPSVRAHVNTRTGEVRFTDAQGKLYVEENHGGGKTFEPFRASQTTADGTPLQYLGWTTHLLFESPADEAFFGLGQHQADEWNYKGRNEELFQYNTKVSVPFVLSSRNYGIMLDSYSLCRFGNPEDYQQLHRLFRLYDKDGKEGALTGTYSAPGNETLVRREDSIYYENLKSAKNLPQFPLEKATVVYEGEIVPMTTGEYRFCHYYSGYQRIYIDGKPVYTEDLAATGKEDQTIWRTAWNPNARKFSIKLEAGKRYSIKLEWKPDGGEAYCGLRAYAPVSDAEQGKLSLWSEMTKQLDYYFVAGNNLDEVISGYRTLTGKAPIMPKWTLGYWQSRERYKTQDEIVDALKGFRQRKLPIDNIVMDWNYWKPDEWGAFTFEALRFASPRQMVQDIHDMHARIMISCWPKYYLTVDNFHELNNRGMIYQQSINDSIYDWLGYKYAFYDAYDTAARKIFWRQLYEKLGTLGIDAWWMDASEPNIRDCTDLAYRKLLCGPTKLGSSDEYFNAYSIVNAEAIYDGQRGYETAIEKQTTTPASHWLQDNAQWNQNGYGNQFSPENQRVFLLTRNGFLSEQRYSTATWSGDIGTRWEDMKAQITAGLNFSISGIPYWSQDIGGFSVEHRYEAAQHQFDNDGTVNEDLEEWRELNTRWHQWGMWTPLYRTHGQFPYREPWNIAPEGTPTYNVIASHLDMRYRLMPYIYSLAARVHFSDYTIMRPLVMDFGHDSQVNNIGYQYMFGPSFMVCPVYTYKARQREVYFPKDNCWYDLHTGALASRGGETITAQAPYESIPVYVRGGSIVPYGMKQEYTNQQPDRVITLYVYGGKDGEFTLYEDEGTNYGYEVGRYATIPMTWDNARHTLTIGKRQGTFPGMLQTRTFNIVFVNATNAQGYSPDARGKKVTYKGQEIKVEL